MAKVGAYIYSTPGGRRVNVKALVRDAAAWRELTVRVVMATQAGEGITTTPEQAAAAYDRVTAERRMSRCVG